MSKSKKDGRAKNGGANRGQGQKPRFIEPSKVLYRRIPISIFDEVEAMVERKIRPFLRKKEG